MIPNRIAPLQMEYMPPTGLEACGAAVGALAETLDAHKSAGFDALCIGHEGMVDLHTFTLEGRRGSRCAHRSIN